VPVQRSRHGRGGRGAAQPAHLCLQRFGEFRALLRAAGKEILEAALGSALGGGAESLRAITTGRYQAIQNGQHRVFRHRDGGSIDREVTSLLADVSPGRRRGVVDVGANVGSVCITLVREGAFAGALAVEPAQDTFRHLVKNVARNGLDSAIRCVNAAASATNGTGNLELSRNSGDHRVRVDSPVDAEERYHEHTRPVIRVPLRRLDDLVIECGIELREVDLTSRTCSRARRGSSRPAFWPSTYPRSRNPYRNSANRWADVDSRSDPSRLHVRLPGSGWDAVRVGGRGMVRAAEGPLR
jgi:FkbM family methyltransferase